VSKTILAVDDSASVRQMVSLTLQSAGYRVVEAVDGVDGYAKATSNEIHVVLTDLNMPNMNGIEFIKKYRTHPSSKGIPIVFLTTESDDGLKQEAKAAGASAWMVKPFQQDQLLALMKKVAGA